MRTASCSIPCRSPIKIEIMPEKELLEYQGIRLAPYGAKAYYPAFDITPRNLITKHIYLDGRARKNFELSLWKRKMQRRLRKL